MTLAGHDALGGSVPAVYVYNRQSRLARAMPLLEWGRTGQTDAPYRLQVSVFITGFRCIGYIRLLFVFVGCCSPSLFCVFPFFGRFSYGGFLCLLSRLLRSRDACGPEPLELLS